MAAIARSLSSLLAAAALAACSLGAPPPQASPVQTLANSAHRGAQGNLVLRIHVPRKKKTRYATPQYVSPATAAIKIAITGLTDVRKIAALTPDANGCARGLCTVTIPGLRACPSSAKCYVATIATYDAVAGCPSACTIPVNARELSSNQSVPFAIAKARFNQIDVTLDGIPTSVVLEPAADATLFGNMESGFSLRKCNSPAQPVSVFALDADGNYILGVGAPTPSLVSNDSADLPVTATPSPASPNRFTLTPPIKAAANEVVQLTVGATPLAGSRSASPVTTHVNVTFGDVCGVYVADSGSSAVKEMLAVGASIPAQPTIYTLGSGFNRPIGVAVDSFGNVYVADFNSNAVKEILAVGGSIPSSPTINTLGSGFNEPAGVAVDRFGNVYVASYGSSTVKEMLAVGGSIPASPTIKTLGSGFLLPEGVAVDGLGNVFVADSGNSAVKEMLAVGGGIPASPTINMLGSGFDEPAGVAVDGFGNVYVSDSGNKMVKEILAVNGIIPPASPTIETLASGFEPFGVAVDGLGNVFVADFGNSAVKEILAIGGSIPPSPTIETLGSGFSSPAGLAAR